MAYELENRLVIGVSSRALFDLTVENEIFRTQGGGCVLQVPGRA